MHLSGQDSAGIQTPASAGIRTPVHIPFAKHATYGIRTSVSGRLTCMQINGATIIVDHYSDHVYVFLMRNLSPEETLLAKHAYERFLSSIGVTAKAYYAING